MPPVIYTDAWKMPEKDLLMTVLHSSSPRTALICGPYLCGKTTLFEALLAEAGALKRHSSANSAFSLADSTAEARAHGISTEMNIATADYLGESWTFLDCPGSVELMQETRDAIRVADIAVVVVEPNPDKAINLATYLKMLDELSVPHIVFINKFDKKNVSAMELMEAFQSVSEKPLVLREIPIREGETVTGHVDLVSERAFHWEENKPSSLISLPETSLERETEARAELFESLADFDDTLLEKLLEDVVPSNEEIYSNLATDLSENLVVPVFFGSASHGNGIRRLMKALRHEAPDIATTAARLGISDVSEPHMRIFKTVHAGHAGKLSYGRLMQGSFSNGDTLNKERPASINRIFGRKMEPIEQITAGEVVGLTKLENACTGDTLTPQGLADNDGSADPATPLFSLAIRTVNRGDDVKLSDNLKKVLEEDPSLSANTESLTGEQVLRGQGDLHLKICLEKLKNRSGLEIEASPPSVAYRETMRKKVEKRVRHKKQSGGHGEFGEVQLSVAPRGQGEGFEFTDAIHGGVVPRQYISAVKAGIEESMAKGPMGHPVVDVSVTLMDGKHHSVDSSEMAFRKAGAQAMKEALADGYPVLLEPIHQVKIHAPSTFIAGVQKIILGHRGQIFGIDAKDGWVGWDVVSSQIPEKEMQSLIIEVRSVTMGVGTFETEFDRLQELTGKELAKALEESTEASTLR